MKWRISLFTNRSINNETYSFSFYPTRLSLDIHFFSYLIWFKKKTLSLYSWIIFLDLWKHTTFSKYKTNKQTRIISFINQAGHHKFHFYCQFIDRRNFLFLFFLQLYFAGKSVTSFFFFPIKYFSRSSFSLIFLQLSQCRWSFTLFWWGDQSYFQLITLSYTTFL